MINIYKNKLVIEIIILALFIISYISLLVSRNNKVNMINDLQIENNILLKEIQHYQNERDIQQKILGKIILLNKYKILRSINNSGKLKLVIFSDENSCKPCFFRTLNFFRKKFSKNKDINLAVVIGARKSHYVQTLNKQYKNIQIFVNSDYRYNKYDFNKQKVLVCLLDKESVCLYLFFVRENNENKLFEYTNIIQNFIEKKVSEKL